MADRIHSVVIGWMPLADGQSNAKFELVLPRNMVNQRLLLLDLAWGWAWGLMQ